MLTRLLVLTAVIAAFFVFVPTSSAQSLPEVPRACERVTDTADVTEGCVEALQLPLPGGGGGGGGGSTLPQECQEILGVIGGMDGGSTVPLLDQLTATQLLQLVACLTAITGVDDGEDEEEEPVNEDADLEETGDNGVDDAGGLGVVEDFDVPDDEEFRDDGDFPRGAVESGYGPTGSDEAGAAPLAARGLALLALLGVLATGLVVMRRRSGS